LSTKKEKLKALENAAEALEKTHGEGSIMRVGSRKIVPIDVIPTQIFELDHYVIGAGGFPRGRIVEVYGPEACLDGDSFIQYSIRTKEGRRQNQKGGTIRRLFQRFNSIPTKGKGYYQRACTKDAVFFATSINEEGRVFQNRVLGVFYAGDKPCFKLTTQSGRAILASADHKFFVGNKYVELGSLQVGDTLYIHNNTRFKCGDNTERPYRKDLLVKHHPVAGTKVIEGKYTYHRIAQSRATVEAEMNGMSLDAYVALLNAGDIEGIRVLSREDHVHHIDENPSNDALSNLVVIIGEEHNRLHATLNHNYLRFTAVPDSVASVEYAGVRDTYDIRMAAPFNNYVANEFIVHNSGKTTIALQVVANVQQGGGTAAYIDAEHALDLNYAQSLGVETNDVFLSQPDNGEQALEIADGLIETGMVDIVVVDSVAALIPAAELNGEMTDQFMGLQARLMGKAMRKLAGKVRRTGTCLVFINQIREKIGVQFGSPETTPGGRALKFAASLRLDVRRTEQVKDGEAIVGAKTKFKAAKNKIAAPLRECSVDLLYGTGFDKAGSLVAAGLKYGVVEKSGSWYNVFGDRIGQGALNAAQTVRSSPELFTKIAAAILKIKEEETKK
jgi:recombination protein RecA